MLTSLTPTSRAVFTIAAQVSSGKGTPFFGAVGAHFPFGIAGDQHSVNAGDRFSRPDKVDVARDFAVEEIAGIDHFGIDINSEHAVGEAPVRPGRTGAGQRAAEQFADEGQTRALVLAEGADRALALTVVARTLEHRRRDHPPLIDHQDERHPLTSQRGGKWREPRNISSGVRKTINVMHSNRVADHNKHGRNRRSFPMKSSHCRISPGKDGVWLHPDYFFRIGFVKFSISRAPTIHNL